MAPTPLSTQAPSHQSSRAWISLQSLFSSTRGGTKKDGSTDFQTSHAPESVHSQQSSCTPTTVSILSLQPSGDAVFRIPAYDASDGKEPIVLYDCCLGDDSLTVERRLSDADVERILEQGGKIFSLNSLPACPVVLGDDGLQDLITRSLEQARRTDRSETKAGGQPAGLNDGGLIAIIVVLGVVVAVMSGISGTLICGGPGSEWMRDKWAKLRGKDVPVIDQQVFVLN